MKSAIFHEEAKAELKEAVTWYDNKCRGLGLRFAEDMSRAVRCIQEDPQRWPVKIDKMRRYLMKRFPYAVVYMETEKHIWIVAVAHLKRKPDYWTGRQFSGTGTA
jgi:toxin ParE1/3/4